MENAIPRRFWRMQWITDVVEYSLSRSLSQTMIAEYKTKLIDKSILQRKLAELYDIAEEEVKNSQQD